MISKLLLPSEEKLMQTKKIQRRVKLKKIFLKSFSFFWGGEENINFRKQVIKEGKC